jgi:nitroreductase
MDLKDAISQRRSIRAFRPDPVPRQVLEDIMGKALWAPSWGNTQPWGFTVVSGNALSRIKEGFLDKMRQGISPAPELTMPRAWDDTQTRRYKELGRGLFRSLGIAREDHQKRGDYYTEMTRFFGAPTVIYLHLERDFSPYALMDGGLILQTIALLALDQGLGTCYLARSVHYPEVVRAHAAMPPGRTLVMGTAIGYAIQEHPANVFRSRRGEPGEFIHWVDS